jgi:acetolactate synthase-1/2/3 large subunit
VAGALGAHGEDVLQSRELEGALQRAAAACKPACVNVMIERLPAPRY